MLVRSKPLYAAVLCVHVCATFFDDDLRGRPFLGFLARRLAEERLVLRGKARTIHFF